MDGVIVDFARGALKHHGIDLPYDSIRWDFDKKLFPHDRSKFWATLGFDFWAGLDWTPNGRTLAGMLLSTYPNSVTICTSPCLTPGCIDGKIEWIRNNIPELSRKFIITPIKEVCAKGNILIDDNEINCKKFWEAGGATVLVPQPWNYRWPGHDFNIMDEIENARRSIAKV